MIDASDAAVFWQPDLSSCVLPVLAVPARAPTDIPFITAANLRCRMAVFATSRSLQHVVFLTAGRRLQLAVRGGDIRDRVRLLTDAVIERRAINHRLRLIERLADLAASGDLSPRLYPPEPRGRRLRIVLQALDGALAGASQQEIAAALFGARRAEADWRDPRGHLRDQVRRAIARGRFLMQRGYLGFLI